MNIRTCPLAYVMANCAVITGVLSADVASSDIRSCVSIVAPVLSPGAEHGPFTDSRQKPHHQLAFAKPDMFMSSCRLAGLQVSRLEVPPHNQVPKSS